MRVLVVTVVHHPHDARIAARQIPALLAAGHDVTYAAPFSSTATEPSPGIQAVDLPRAKGRHRLEAIRAARRLLRQRRDIDDLVMIHDPELILSVPRRASPPVVWDVHEETPAALVDKPWMPSFARPLAAVGVRAAERRAKRRFHLLLAETGYRNRYGDHPVVPNEPVVPEDVSPPGDQRVVYVGRISIARGLRDLLALSDLLAPGVRLELVGDADPEVVGELRTAADAGVVIWHGRLPYDAALARVDGALAGLSLLHDLPNYRHSRPTKVVEYMSRGVPVVTTPNPVAAAIVNDHQCGHVVPFGDVAAVAEAVERLRTHPHERIRMGSAGHAAALEHFNWQRTAPAFVSVLERWARPAS